MFVGLVIVYLKMGISIMGGSILNAVNTLELSILIANANKSFIDICYADY